VQGELEKRVGEWRELLTFSLAEDELLYMVLRERLLKPLEGAPFVQASGRGAVFVGDLHGDFQSLLSAFGVWRGLARDGWLLVFLGDYADRGPQGLEVLLGVLLLKASYPRSVLVLRGNHEDPEVNRRYGFLEELRAKLGRYAGVFYDTLVAPAYARMPVVARLEVGGRRVLAIHGGPSPGLTPESVRKLPMERRPRDTLLVNLLWSDPREYVDYAEPSFRGAGNLYGQRLVEEALRAFSADLLVRGHEAVEGVKSTFGGKLYTVFSCRHYEISPSVLLINGGVQEVKLQ